MYLSWLGDVEQAQANFDATIKNAMLERSATQAGTSLALMGVVTAMQVAPGVGQIIGALTAVGFKYFNNKFEKQIKAEIAEAQQWCADQAAPYDAKLKAVEASVAEDESRGATALYVDASLKQMGYPQGASTPGLGDIWSSAGSALQKAFKPAQKIVVQGSKLVVTAMVAPILEPVRLVAKATGHDTAADKIASFEKKTIDTVTKVATPAAIVDPESAYQVGKKAWNTLTGQEALYEARDSIAALKAQVIAALDKDFATQSALRQTPDYRTKLRETIADNMVSDPAFAQVMVTKYFPAALKYLTGPDGKWLGIVKPSNSGLVMAIGTALGLLGALGAAAVKR